MAYVHIGHDCVVGDHCIFANNASISGHVEVGDHANLGGYCGVPQYRRIGAHSMIGGMSLVLKDVPDFVTVSGNPAAAIGLNVEGLRRRGVDGPALQRLKAAYRLLYRSGLGVADALAAIEAGDDPDGRVAQFVASVRQAQRGIVRPRVAARPQADDPDAPGDGDGEGA